MSDEERAQLTEHMLQLVLLKEEVSARIACLAAAVSPRREEFVIDVTRATPDAIERLKAMFRKIEEEWAARLKGRR